ncbi:MAG: glycosyltransferase family 2 protein [Chloroflexi bacterium]|nr:glycosyltransferase family 2 protein [Chloroflexota bacterium]
MGETVGIIILHWNSPDDTKGCIESMLALTGVSYQVIVVNNNPQYDAQWMQDRYARIKLLTTGKNLGYAGGNNAGIRYALDHGCDYVWLVNDDIVAAPDSLAALMTVARSEPEAGFLGPKVYLREEPDHFLSAGVMLGPDVQPQHRGLGERDHGQFESVVDVDYVTGCAMLVSQRAIEAVGMFDEEFFAYHEDTEWCFRGRRAGFKVLFVPGAKAWHPDTRRRDVDSPLVTYYITRNSLLFARKQQLGGPTLVRLLSGYTRTLLSWSIRPKWHHKQRQRNALARAIVDYARGKTGSVEGL